MATIVSAGLAWVALGALVKSGLVVSVPLTIIQRVSAVALVLFAGLLIARLLRLASRRAGTLRDSRQEHPAEILQLGGAHAIHLRKLSQVARL